jgi:hypothetical protein
MNKDQSDFIINIQDNSWEIDFNYIRETGDGGDFIVIRIYDLEVFNHTFDSVKSVCSKEKCLSNETTFRLYF